MVTTEISLDVWKRNNIVVNANTGEIDSRYIEVSFYGEHQEKIILENRYVLFYAKKPDGTTIFNYCTVDTENNTATIKLTSQTLSVSGVLECEFQILDGEDILLKVNGLRIFVSSCEDFLDAIESTSESNVLISTINSVKELSKNVGNLNSLTTSDKTTVVGAVNEINQKLNDSYSECASSIGELNSLTTTQKNNIVEAVNEVNQKAITAYVLYSNSSGTQATITINDSSENYNYFEIYYHKDPNQMICSKIYKPNGKAIMLQNIGYYDSAVFSRSGILDVAGNTLTWRATDLGWGMFTNSSNSIVQQNVFYVNQIIGYK